VLMQGRSVGADRVLIQLWLVWLVSNNNQ
jgi:hypothetical protein